VTLAKALLARPNWQKQAWRFLAEYHADQNDYQAAYETVRRFAKPPPLPKVEPGGELSELETKFLLAPDDLTKGLCLHAAQLQAGRFDDALRTLRKMQRILHPPSYLWFMEAEAHARAQDWASAWRAWSDFNSGATR
jgi:Flp pilus assembly protein TadD